MCGHGSHKAVYRLRGPRRVAALELEELDSCNLAVAFVGARWEHKPNSNIANTRTRQRIASARRRQAQVAGTGCTWPFIGLLVRCMCAGHGLASREAASLAPECHAASPIRSHMSAYIRGVMNASAKHSIQLYILSHAGKGRRWQRSAPARGRCGTCPSGELSWALALRPERRGPPRGPRTDRWWSRRRRPCTPCSRRSRGGSRRRRTTWGCGNRASTP